MARRLYLRLYVSFLGVLLAVIIVAGAINFLTGHAFTFLRAGPRMASHLARMLPPTDRREPLDRAVDQLHDELGVDIVVLGPDGERLAGAGAPVPPLDAGTLERIRSKPGWLPGRGMVGGPVRGGPGAVLVARLPIPEGTGRAAIVRTLLLLLATLLVSLLLVYPLSRSITRPLEKLTAVVEGYGRNDFSKRSGLGQRPDEVGKLARSFDEMADRIQAARRAEKELLANVSHELRTPLARIKVALELTGARDDAVKRRLAVVDEEVDELDRLIADVLTASRLDLAAAPLRKVRIRIAGLVEKSRQRALALEPGLQVGLSVDPGLEVEADEALLCRALDNLLDNARKYGGGTPLDLEARREGGEAVLAVRDRGPGIPPEELGRVFDPFFRGEGARGQASGFGLGLSLARRVAEAHGGTARAENAEGGGTRIELRLPAA